jgi:hypothetical protein
VTGFPEFPNTSPSGKRVDCNDPIPGTFRKFSKNVTLGTSEYIHVALKPYNGLIEVGFAELPPLSPINRRLALLNFFTALLLFLRTIIFPLRERSSRAPPEFVTFRPSSSLSEVSFLSLFSFRLFFSLSFLFCELFSRKLSLFILTL